MTTSVVSHLSDLLPATDRPLTLAELTALVTAVGAAEDRWRPRLEIPAPGADRWWTRLHAGADVDVWLLSWLPGQTTELHDHGPSRAAFTVVQGRLAEDRVHLDRRRHHVRPTGAVTAIPLGVRHDVTGAGDGPAVSVHAYSPPLTQMNYYDAAGRPARSVRTHEPEEELIR